MPSSRRRVSERGMTLSREAKLLTPARARRIWLTAQTSIFRAGGAVPAEDKSRDQICTSPGADILDDKSYLGLGLGSRSGAGAV